MEENTFAKLKQKLFVKNLRTPTVKVFQLCRFKYLLYIEMYSNNRSPIFIKKIMLNLKIFVQNLSSLGVLVF